MSNKIEKLKERYLKLHPEDAIDESSLREVEQLLKLHIPDDFKQISKFYGGGYLGGYSIFDFEKSKGDYNIADKTIFYRNSDLSLDRKFIALSESEVNFVVFDVEANGGKGEVYMYGIPDIYNVCDGSGPKCDYDYFPCFTDFFEYLVEREEESQKEDQEIEW